jgi:hypothetical protein
VKPFPPPSTAHRAFVITLDALRRADNENARLLAIRNFAQATAAAGRAADGAAAVLCATAMKCGISSETVLTLFEQGRDIARARGSKPPPLPAGRPTPRATVEAVMYAVRARGLRALKEPATKARLACCDAAASAWINRRIDRLSARGKL